jgi:simple sugar transport system permease protein
LAALVAGALAGALWAAVAGALKSWRGAHEVVSTIMLNYIAIGLSRYLVDGPLNAGTYTAQTKPIATTAELPVLWQAPPTAVDAGLVLALALAAVVALLLRRSVWGYELRVVGANPRAALEAGMSLHWVRFGALAFGGAMAGLAGAVLVLGTEHVFTATLSPGFGYDGIAVALLAAGRAWAAPLSALLFGALRSADKAFQLEAGLSPQVIYVIEAVLIIGVATRGRWGRRLRPRSLPAEGRVP